MADLERIRKAAEEELRQAREREAEQKEEAARWREVRSLFDAIGAAGNYVEVDREPGFPSFIGNAAKRWSVAAKKLRSVAGVKSTADLGFPEEEIKGWDTELLLLDAMLEDSSEEAVADALRAALPDDTDASALGGLRPFSNLLEEKCRLRLGLPLKTSPSPARPANPASDSASPEVGLVESVSDEDRRRQLAIDCASSTKNTLQLAKAMAESKEGKEGGWTVSAVRSWLQRRDPVKGGPQVDTALYREIKKAREGHSH